MTHGYSSTAQGPGCVRTARKLLPAVGTFVAGQGLVWLNLGTLQSSCLMLIPLRQEDAEMSPVQTAAVIATVIP